jgi:hypothetical protein
MADTAAPRRGADTSAPLNAKPPYPTRFGWGMRLFLSFVLFAIVFRGFSVCFPWADWAKALDMRTRPRRLPTPAEIAGRGGEASDKDPHPVRDDVLAALDSVWDFFKPWPEPAARPNLRTWADGGRWALVWLSSRLEFVENVLGANEEWPMFSPSVSRAQDLARARLVYADGSEKVVRSKGDPEDLTRYSHWFQEKVLDHELKVQEGEAHADDNFGWCNLLAHRYARSEAGAELTRIYLFKVRYKLAPPRADAGEWLRRQTGPPADQLYKDFYEYDVSAAHGKPLLERYD